MALRKIRRGWYIYWRDPDGQHTRSLHTRDEAAARALHEEFLRWVDERRRTVARFWLDPDAENLPGPPPVIPPPAELPAGEHRRGGIAIADMWDTALSRRALSRTHGVHWRRFVREIGVKYADQVTPQLALEYLERTYGGGNGKSYNNAKSTLNTIYRCCLVEAGLSVSPFAPIVNRRVTEVEHHRNLTAAEFDRAFAAAPPHLRLLMMLSRWTCQRLETCARMTPAMFDFTRKVFIIQPGKTSRFKKWVCCPIMPPLEDFIKPLLARCKDRRTPILRELYTRRRCADLSCDFVKLLKSVDISDTDAGKASFHSIRGTAITWYKERIPGDILRMITGHASDAVEDIYARPVENVSRIAQNAADFM